MLTDLQEQVKRIDAQLNNLFAIKANLEARIEVKRGEVDAWLQDVFQKCGESNDSRVINLGDDKSFKIRGLMSEQKKEEALKHISEAKKLKKHIIDWLKRQPQA